MSVGCPVESYKLRLLRQMLELGRLLKKPKMDDNELQQFGARIAADQKKLKDLVARRSKTV